MRHSSFPVAAALTLAALLAAASPSDARAVTFNAGGAVGYESVRGEFGGDENLGGLGLTASFSAEVTKIAGPTGLLLGAQLSHYNVEGDNGNVTTEFQQTTVGPFLGLNAPVAQRFSLQVLLGYDFGISGELAVETNNVTVSRDTESFGRVVHEWRGLFDVAQAFSLGFGLGWSAGATEIEAQNPELDFRAFGFKALANYQF